MTKSKLLTSGALAAAAALLAGHASAQSINYSALQEVFNEPVTTSATGSPQRAFEAPVAMEIITAEDIKRSGATDIPTILSRLAGIDVMTFGAGGASDVSVRGYDSPFSPRLLVLINGRQVYLDHYGYTAWNTLPVQLSEIKQIEVVEGPNSALFGFNAVGGVVNIITVNPKYDTVNAASASVGVGAFHQASMVSTFRLSDRVQTRISMGGSGENQWKNDGAVSPSFMTNPNKISGNLDTVAQITDNTELRVEGSWSHAMETDVLPTYQYALSKYLTNSIKATLNSDTKLGLITVDAYQNNLSSKYNFVDGLLDYNNTITVAQAQDLFKVGASNTFRVGLEFRHNELNTQPIAGGEVSYNVFAASGMWNWAVTNKLSVTTAARYDNLDLSRTGPFPAGFPLSDNALYSRTIGEPSVNVGAVYKLTPLDSLRASFARGVQIPSLVELGGLNLPLPVGPFTVAIMGEPLVKPTIVTSYELAYDRMLPSLGAQVGVNIFTQQTDQMTGLPTTTALDVAPTQTTYPAIFFADNVGSSQMTGAEVRASGKIKGGYHWNANWTYTDVTDHADAGQDLVAHQVNYAQLTPANRGNLGFGWADDKWSLDGYLRYVSSFHNDLTTGKLGDYTTFAGHASYALSSKVTVAMTVENAMVARQIQSSPLESERRVFATLSTSW